MSTLKFDEMEERHGMDFFRAISHLDSSYLFILMESTVIDSDFFSIIKKIIQRDKCLPKADVLIVRYLTEITIFVLIHFAVLYNNISVEKIAPLLLKKIFYFQALIVGVITIFTFDFFLFKLLMENYFWTFNSMRVFESKTKFN